MKDNLGSTHDFFWNTSPKLRKMSGFFGPPFFFQLGEKIMVSLLSRLGSVNASETGMRRRVDGWIGG